MAIARDRLPAEPSAGEPSVSIAVRLPNGRRVTRAFPPSAPLTALRDFITSEVEDVASGYTFSLKEPFPGSPNMDLEVPGATLESQGLAAAGSRGVSLVMSLGVMSL